MESKNQEPGILGAGCGCYCRAYSGIPGPVLVGYDYLGGDFREIFVKAISNPVVIVSVVVSVWNLITDPTTKGLGDSKQALTYQKPKEG